MGNDVRAQGHRVLICAPHGQDAATVAAILSERHYAALVCRDLDELAERLDDDTGVIVLTLETLACGLMALQKSLNDQPTWSDVPLILLAARSTGHLTPADLVRERLLELAVNAVVLERPLSATSLVSATRSAIRARQRQFDMRDRLKELDAQCARLDTLLAHLPIGVAFVDRNRSTVISNPAFLRFRPDGTIPSSDAIIDAQWEGFDDSGQPLPPAGYPVARALKGDPVVETELRFKPTSGAPRWTRVNAVPLRESDGQITGAILVIVDVDEIKRAQDALAQSASRLEEQVLARTAQLEQTVGQLKAAEAERERAEESLRQSQKMEAVGQLTGGIAHDFNNMLTGIIGSLEIMRRRIASGRLEDVNRFMDAATTSAKRAAAFTQRLLAFSRRQSLDAQPIAVDQLIFNIKDLLDRAIDERVVLHLDLAPDLPRAVIDPHQLESAILNLAINARDAMPSGGSLTIQTTAREVRKSEAEVLGIVPGPYVVIAVRDTGVGMPPEVLQKVFEPFFTTKPLGQGTGLGLSMVYGFAKQSGGQIHVESEPNVGTTVRLYLPTTVAPAKAPDEKGPSISCGAGERVMVVEDDESVLLFIREVLQELNYQPVEFDDPLKALPVLASNERLDLMISDVGLPAMNGRQLAEFARQHRPDLPVLLITGYAENAAIRTSLSSAKMSMLTKPFSLDVLAVRIRQMIEKSTNPAISPALG